MNADTGIAEDRQESVSQMEPMQISDSSRHRENLADLAFELATHSAGFRSSLPEGVFTALADLVRSMNCYYSNLIEGHDTHPVDIERALKQDYSLNPEQRNLQLEAEAHISVQKWIDEGGLSERSTSAEGIREIHQRFCDLLPEDLLYVENPETGERRKITPGILRQTDVQVGRLIAISAGALPRFLGKFENTYGSLGKTETIIAAAAAHHRLLWIHPFLDGNGRVARLMSHAMLMETMNTGGIWSIARGLARNELDYKSHLAQCDHPRQGDLDGRGNLSEEALVKFTVFFLETCLDQVKFMETLVQPNQLRTRILNWVETEVRQNKLQKKAGNILEAILYRGELPRGEVAGILDTSDRTARRTIATLMDYGVITSSSTRAPLRLAFPAKMAPEWMPGLFPEK